MTGMRVCLFVLFAIRDAKQESLWFSPAEIVFGHNLRGPLKEKLVGDNSCENVSDFVTSCRERLHQATRLAKESHSSSQVNMKRRFDKKAVERQFGAGDKVLVLLPTPGSALAA